MNPRDAPGGAWCGRCACALLALSQSWLMSDHWLGLAAVSSRSCQSPSLTTLTTEKVEGCDSREPCLCRYTSVSASARCILALALLACTPAEIRSSTASARQCGSTAPATLMPPAPSATPARPSRHAATAAQAPHPAHCPAACPWSSLAERPAMTAPS